MRALDQIARLGASVGLGDDGKLFLDGLDKLPQEKAARAIQIAKANKELLRMEINGELCSPTSSPDYAKKRGKQISCNDDVPNEAFAKAISMGKDVFGNVKVKFIPPDASPPLAKRNFFWPRYRPSPKVCQACNHMVAYEYCRWNVDYRGGKCPRHLNSLIACPAVGLAIDTS